MELGVLESSGLTASMIAILLIVYKLIKTMDGRRLRSSCCGYKADIGFQTESMTPTAPPTIVIHNPMPVPLLRSANNVSKADERIHDRERDGSN